jgi:hypothetical protein
MGSKSIDEMFSFSPETNTKRQVTQHGCLASLLVDGYKKIG